MNSYWPDYFNENRNVIVDTIAEWSEECLEKFCSYYKDRPDFFRYDCEASIEDLYALSNKCDAYYDRVSSGYAYTLHYYPRRLNTALWMIAPGLLSTNAPSEIEIRDWGCGTGATLGALRLLQNFRKLKQLPTIDISYIGEDCSPFMLRAAQLLNENLARKLPTEHLSVSFRMDGSNPDGIDTPRVKNRWITANFMFDHSDLQRMRDRRHRTDFISIVNDSGADKLFLATTRHKSKILELLKSEFQREHFFTTSWRACETPPQAPIPCDAPIDILHAIQKRYFPKAHYAPRWSSREEGCFLVLQRDNSESHGGLDALKSESNIVQGCARRIIQALHPIADQFGFNHRPKFSSIGIRPILAVEPAIEKQAETVHAVASRLSAFLTAPIRLILLAPSRDDWSADDRSRVDYLKSKLEKNGISIQVSADIFPREEFIATDNPRGDFGADVLLLHTGLFGDAKPETINTFCQCAFATKHALISIMPEKVCNGTKWHPYLKGLNIEFVNPWNRAAHEMINDRDFAESDEFKGHLLL